MKLAVISYYNDELIIQKKKKSLAYERWIINEEEQPMFVYSEALNPLLKNMFKREFS